MSQQLSLYIDLKPGAKVDLAAAAKAALAFDAAVKEIAFFFEPAIQVRIELESGTEGSLSLNSLISATGLNDVRLKAIAWAVMTFFVLDTASYTYQKILDNILDDPEISERMSEEEMEELAQRIARILGSKTAHREVGKVYQELQRDDAVRGVGVSPKHGRKPNQIVPRSEFEKRGRVVQESEATGQRVETSVAQLTLLSPVLVRDSPRKWKFKSGKIEFGAPVKDAAFLERVLSGREPVPMSEGIIMKVKLTVKEAKVDGVWQIKDRVVEEVMEISRPPAQDNLALGLPGEEDDDDQ
jgi:hypothetical protein